MTLSDRYRRLATLIDALEAQGLTVRSAAPSDGSATERTPDTEMGVTLELELPSDATLDRIVERTSGRTSAPVDDSERERPPVSSQADQESTADSQADTVRNGSVSSQSDDGDASPETTDEAVDETDSEPSGASTVTSDVDVTDDSSDDGNPDATAIAATSDTGETNGTGGTDTDDTDKTDETSDAAADTDAAVDCTHPECDRTFETERGMKIHRTKAHSLSDLLENGTDEAVHCDPEVLARVYDQYDTFAEMTEALDVDVGPQAVRKQMIRHDIHEPGKFTRSGPSREAGSSSPTEESPTEESGTDQSETLIADGDDSGSRHSARDDPASDDSVDRAPASDTAAANGTSTRPDASSVDDDARSTDDDDVQDTDSHGDSDGGADADDAASADESPDDSDDPDDIDDQLPHLDLPNSLSVADLRTAVEDATTLYDVQRALGLDREECRDLLGEYDLLELVTGRAATVREREELKTEIHERLQRAAT